MKTSVEQSLVDSGDPLALSLIKQGASTFQLKPISEWRYCIYKVQYFLGDVNHPEQSRITQEGYVLSMPNWIEDDAGEAYHYCDWFKWEVVEDNIKFCGNFIAKLFSSVEKLKEHFKR